MISDLLSVKKVSGVEELLRDFNFESNMEVFSPKLLNVLLKEELLRVLDMNESL